MILSIFKSGEKMNWRKKERYGFGGKGKSTSLLEKGPASKIHLKKEDG